MRKILIIILSLCTIAFGLTQLDTENADRDLTSQVTVLTHTPSATEPMQCQGLIYLGDGSKNLSGKSGTFQVEVTIGGRTLQPTPQRVFFDTATSSCIYTPIFPVPDNNEVVIKVLSPISNDTDVDVTAYLYSLDPQITAIKAKTDLITILDTTVKDANDANNFTIEDGTDVNDAYWFHVIMVEDADGNQSKEVRWIDQYDENSGDPNVWVDEPFSFTPAANDIVHIMGTSYGGYLYSLYQSIRQRSLIINIIDGTGSGTSTSQQYIIKEEETGELMPGI